MIFIHVLQLETILGDYGIVVITRSGSNPEKFIYDSDMLTKHRVSYLEIILIDDFCFIRNIFAEKHHDYNKLGHERSQFYDDTKISPTRREYQIFDGRFHHFLYQNASIIRISYQKCVSVIRNVLSSILTLILN